MAISTYALCGFSNPASIGVQIGALSFMAPTRRGHVSQVNWYNIRRERMRCVSRVTQISQENMLQQSDYFQVAIRAFIAGSAACFLTACVAGTLIVDPALYRKRYGQEYGGGGVASNCTYITATQ